MRTPRTRVRSQLASLETVFRALADQTRLRILNLLAAGETCVCDIHENLGLPQPKVSRHLAYLRRTGLVQTRKDGLWVHYRLSELPDEVSQTLLRTVRECLAQLSITARDRERYIRRAGCCVPPTGDTGSPTVCCGVAQGSPEAKDQSG